MVASPAVKAWGRSSPETSAVCPKEGFFGHKTHQMSMQHFSFSMRKHFCCQGCSRGSVIITALESLVVHVTTKFATAKGFAAGTAYREQQKSHASCRLALVEGRSSVDRSIEELETSIVAIRMAAVCHLLGVLADCLAPLKRQHEKVPRDQETPIWQSSLVQQASHMNAVCQACQGLEIPMELGRRA